MDGREHDVATSSSQKPCDQEFLRPEVEKRHPQDTENFLLMSKFEQAQTGHEDAQGFFQEALQSQNAMVHAFLVKRAYHGDTVAYLLLRGYYLSLLLDMRAGDERAAAVFCRHVEQQEGVAHGLLVELIARGDGVARQILYASYTSLLERLLKGSVSVQQFFHEQLRCQNVSALEFLSERAVADDRVCTALLYPYYQSLLPQAVENTPEMAIFQKQLEREDGMVEAFLVQQIEEGSDDAFRVLWVTYRQGIFRYVKGMIGNETVAEDLIAETFLKAWRSLPTRRNKERKMNFRTWLQSVAHSVTMDYLKTGGRRTLFLHSRMQMSRYQDQRMKCVSMTRMNV